MFNNINFSSTTDLNEILSYSRISIVKYNYFSKVKYKSLSFANFKDCHLK
jgi:hypothetical protein